MITDQRTIKEIYLDMLVDMAEQDGLRETVHYASGDRYMCEVLGVDYCAVDVYSQVKKVINDYRGVR